MNMLYRVKEIFLFWLLTEVISLDVRLWLKSEKKLYMAKSMC